MNCLKAGCSNNFVQKIFTRNFQLDDPKLQRNVFGLNFKNPVGLGAGFDKNALYLRELETLGFGFVEIGTVTPKPQGGNEKPRLFRLPKDKALINRMGFNNDGVEAIRKRLENRENKNSNINTPGFIIGGNIGKNKVTANENAWKDYEICFKELFGCVDYFVVNVSSPNTPGLRELQEKEFLKKILSNLQSVNAAQVSQKPLLLKIAPDLNQAQVDDIIELAIEVNLSGLVVANTTIGRNKLLTLKNDVEKIGDGGLSGKPLKEKATELLKYVITHSGNKIPVIASGGIFTGEDATEKINAGATLIQVWTGFIYEGPFIVKRINRFLLNNKEVF